MESQLSNAISSVQESVYSFCKFLSANDTKSTKSHQSGYLIGKSAWPMFFDKEPIRGQNLKVGFRIKWQNDFETISDLTYYGSAKNEFRLTRFGRNFPFREESNTGDLFVLCKVTSNYFKAFILSHDEEIEDFFAAFNISANETNTLIRKEITGETALIACFTEFVNRISKDFPSTSVLSETARKCFDKTGLSQRLSVDDLILRWIDSEYELFKLIENHLYSEIIKNPFDSVESFVKFANTVLNRRKSRAGTSLELHLSDIFRRNEIKFSTQSKTEGEKKPDFIFPGETEYKNRVYPSSKLVMLAAKTTCKDRWRQILQEADRIKVKHLFTLQQGISVAQLNEMKKSGVKLVVPKQYFKKFPESSKSDLISLNDFILQVKRLQSL